ncbi:MAG: FtsW/RodA/SpoVE family cell cycle protein [Planctomycetes bacterium]|nr:FtsW/RodA/SpoVE family cell cycle protein [Planctomycetota bacterium]
MSPPATQDHTRALFVALAAVLVGFGAVMVQSASMTSWPAEAERLYFSRHVVFLLVAVAVGAVCARLPASFWFRAAPWLFAAVLVLLAAVLIPSVGTRVNGARRWLRVGSLSVQPAELAKLALPLLLCRLMRLRHAQQSRSFVRSLALVWPLAVTVPLVLLEPDLGTASFLAAGALVALFVGGWPLKNFAALGAVAVPCACAMVWLRPYQLRRITGLLEAWSDLNQAPYQLRQSLLALGEGGWFGVGLGRGWQKLSFLPEANTDFVFAVVGEELGLIATVGLLAVWAGLYAAGLRAISHLPRGGFAYPAAFALLTQLVLQAATNVAVVTALVPPTGIPHPLLSYGGTNLVVSMATVGIVLSLSRPTDS